MIRRSNGGNAKVSLVNGIKFFIWAIKGISLWTKQKKDRTRLVEGLVFCERILIKIKDGKLNPLNSSSGANIEEHENSLTNQMVPFYPIFPYDHFQLN